MSLELKLVLLYECVLGQGVPQENTLTDLLAQHQDTILDGFREISAAFPHIVAKVEKKGVVLPRYVRVNTLKTTCENVIETFTRDRFQLVESKSVAELTTGELMRDEIVPNLLVFPAGTDLHDHDLYKRGDIVLQVGNYAYVYFYAYVKLLPNL